jgi:hypothetical protein
MSEPGCRQPHRSEADRSFFATVRNLRRYAAVPSQMESGKRYPRTTAGLRSGRRLTMFVGSSRQSIALDCPTGFIRSLGILQMIRTEGSALVLEQSPLPGGVPSSARERWLPLAGAPRTGSGTR